MSRCIYCGTETQLYINDQPVCLKCDADRTTKRDATGTGGSRQDGSHVMSEQVIIDHLSDAACLVHVLSPDAYEAFAKGKVIFDVSPDGERLQAFIPILTPEFDEAVVQRGPVSLPEFPGVSIRTVYHKHKGIETAMPELGNIEDQALREGFGSAPTSS
jgi:hypothetical protein